MSHLFFLGRCIFELAQDSSSTALALHTARCGAPFGVTSVISCMSPMLSYIASAVLMLAGAHSKSTSARFHLHCGLNRGQTPTRCANRDKQKRRQRQRERDTDIRRARSQRRQKGSRDRISPTCTLSQNGYGAYYVPPLIYRASLAHRNRDIDTI